MSTTTFHGVSSPSLLVRAGHYVQGLFQRMIDARQKEAQRYVNAYLSRLDDETLARYGVERSETRDAFSPRFYV